MKKEKFFCSYDYFDEIPQIAYEKFDKDLENINTDGKVMSAFAKIVRKCNEEKMCKLPFKHDIEVKAFKTAFFEMNETDVDGISTINKLKVENLKLDIECLEITQLCQAISSLKTDNEVVAVKVMAPYSVLIELVEMKEFFKLARQDKERCKKLLGKIEECIRDYIMCLLHNGADIISFADPSASIEILGPKFYMEFIAPVNYRLLRSLEKMLDEKIFFLCERFCHDMQSAGMIEVTSVQEIKWRKCSDFMIDNLKNSKVKFIGNTCFNRINKPYETSVFSRITLRDVIIND